MSRRLLVVAAHPDDEVLGCGGLIARTLREGGRCAVLILTEGATTQYPDRPELVARKKDEARAALAGFGAVELVFADLPDMRLATVAPAEVNAPVADAVLRLRPDWVLVHHGGDLNRDHAVAHEAARVACRPTDEYCPRVLAYETPSSTEWGAAPFTPDLYVTLEPGDIDRKVTAFEAYRSEVRPAPHPRDPELIRQRARVRGSECGALHAEAFVTIQERI